MSISQSVASHLPYLRRYARALTGSQQAGDAFVRATLEAAIADDDVAARIGQGRVELYSAFSKIWSSAHVQVPEYAETGSNHEAVAADKLSRITPLNRQVLLLTELEDFSVEEAARIVEMTPDNVASLVREAVEEIASESTTSVLIIEDEPLISMQLEDLVSGLGHEICGTAATRTQAAQVVAESKPGLVLADIQLADGSSGIDAVEDILKVTDVPVIFITAYPERLLTGDRPEPTYLITKPFQESTVRAAISQALFFNSSRALS